MKKFGAKKWNPDPRSRIPALGRFISGIIGITFLLYCRGAALRYFVTDYSYQSLFFPNQNTEQQKTLLKTKTDLNNTATATGARNNLRARFIMKETPLVPPNHKSFTQVIILGETAHSSPPAALARSSPQSTAPPPPHCGERFRI